MICANPKCGKEFDPGNYAKQRCCSKPCNSFFQKNKKRILSGEFQESYTRMCENCGSRFTTHLQSKVFCTKKCKDYKIKKEWVKLNSEKSKTYKVNYRKRKYPQGKINQLIPVITNCVVCSSEFTCSIHNPYQIYCGKKCLKKAEYKRDREKRLEYGRSKSIFRKMSEEEKTKNCPCGKHFKIKISRPGQIYCSIKCQERICGRRTRENNIDKIRETARKWAAEDKKNLGDCYVKGQLLRDIKIDRSILPYELIELKRTQIKLKRKIYGKEENRNSAS